MHRTHVLALTMWAFVGLLPSLTQAGIISATAMKSDNGVVGIGAIPPDGSATSMTVSETFTKVGPLTFTVKVNNPTNDPLALTFNETVTNSTGSTWTDFDFRVMPVTATDLFPNVTRATRTPFTIAFPRGVYDEKPPYEAVRLERGKLFSSPDGTPSLFSPALVIRIKPGANTLTITEIPSVNPEPSSLILGGLGLATVIITYGRAKRGGRMKQGRE